MKLPMNAYHEVVAGNQDGMNVTHCALFSLPKKVELEMSPSICAVVSLGLIGPNDGVK